ncbi:MAG: hypothetical protein LBV12_05270 [Puniceicoccales bacterium]|jgi:hypothetical protein|nr:hypothetical protein [Puniceicoccales bacterium]
MVLSTGDNIMNHFVVGTFGAVQSHENFTDGHIVSVQLGENFADGTFYWLQYHEPLCGWYFRSCTKP